MERLTIRTLYGAKFKGLPPYTNKPEENKLLSEAADRLAAYEDTGKNPEQVERWAKAEQEGRMVVLPCKAGDTIFVAKAGNVLKCEVVDIKHQSTLEHGGTKFIREKILAWGEGLPFLLDWCDIGKTVFPTPEAAETALKEE